MPSMIKRSTLIAHNHPQIPGKSSLRSFHIRNLIVRGPYFQAIQLYWSHCIFQPFRLPESGINHSETGLRSMENSVLCTMAGCLSETVKTNQARPLLEGLAWHATIHILNWICKTESAVRAISHLNYHGRDNLQKLFHTLDNSSLPFWFSTE